MTKKTFFLYFGKKNIINHLILLTILLPTSINLVGSNLVSVARPAALSFSRAFVQSNLYLPF